MNPLIQLRKAAPVFLVAVVCFLLLADNASAQTPTPTATATPTPTPTPTSTPIGTGFVIGDLDAVVDNHVTFWGAQWWKLNHLSGGPAPASFKGFANSPNPNPPACGGTWQSDPGNSSGPPESVPADITVIVSSLITKSGPIISGDVPEMVIVHTDPGYSPNPGHEGTGTVTAVVCQSALLGNISTRGFVQTGNNVMIGGFIIEGTGPKRVIVVAIGPELTQFGVPDVLADPTLELHDRTGALIASNDNWQDYYRRPGRGYPKQRACSDCAKRVRDHRNAAAGKLHRDREGCERYHRGCSGTNIRSVIIFAGWGFGVESKHLIFPFYNTSEPNSPSLTRVRIFIFGLTTVVVRMIWPRSFMVML